MVMLQLFVDAPSQMPMREHDPVTGRLIRVAASGHTTGFRQMGLALLRTFGRHDAAPIFCQCAHRSRFFDTVAGDARADRARCRAGVTPSDGNGFR